MYGINNAGVGGCSGASSAGGLPPNRINASTHNGPPFSHVPPFRRAFPSEIALVRNRQGGLERGVIFPPESGERFRVRNPEAFNGYAVGRQVRMVIDSDDHPHVVLPMVHPTTQRGYHGLNPLEPMADARQAVADWRDQSSRQSSGNRPVQRATRPQQQTRRAARQTTQQTPTTVRTQAQQRPMPTLGTLASQVIYDIGGHLAPDDLSNLSHANRHVANSLGPRRVTANNAMRLARGEATILRNGDIVRLRTPLTGPTQFNQALAYIQQAVPVEHQRPPLRELLRQATTRGQFEAVYDHLEAVGWRPVALIHEHVQQPPNYNALTAASQRAVKIFAWRLTAATSGEENFPMQPEVRQNLLNGYADLLHRVEGMVVSVNIIDAQEKLGRIPELLRVFGAPEGMDVPTGADWLRQQSRSGDLRLTSERFERLSYPIRMRIHHEIPGFELRRLLSDNFVNILDRSFALSPPQI